MKKRVIKKFLSIETYFNLDEIRYVKNFDNRWIFNLVDSSKDYHYFF